LFFPRLIITAVFLLGASATLAQDWFQVEILIFEHSESVQAGQKPENWPNVLDLEWPSPLIQLEPAVERQDVPAVKPPFEELTFDERNLNNDSYAIRVRDAYNLLWHKAWRAPIQPEESAPWIKVQAGEQLGEHYRLEGAIRVHLSRYLHLHTNLWLTEVSGEPIFEQPDSTSEDDDQGNSFNLDQMAADVNAQSRFDWSQLPEVSTVRWGCNYVREFWPEDERLLPADFYEDPAPADWYFPFGCRVPSENPGKDLPIQLSYPTSNFFYWSEIEERFPELTVAMQQTQLFQDQQSLEGIPLEPTRYSPGFPNAEYQFGVDGQEESVNLLAEEADGSNNRAVRGVNQKSSVRYAVDEIVQIQSERRMRSTEFHYIDHPKIGILAVIYPVEKPDLEIDEDSP